MITKIYPHIYMNATMLQRFNTPIRAHARYEKLRSGVAL